MIFLFNENIKIIFLTNIGLMILFALLSIVWIYKGNHPYDLRFAILISSFLYFSLLLLQNIKIKTNLAGVQKIISFFAGYSLTLYLIHYSILDLMRYYIDGTNGLYLFLSSIILSNVLAILIAFNTEMKHKNMAIFLKNKLIKGYNNVEK